MFFFFLWFLWINLSIHAKKNRPKSSWQHHDFSVMFTTENEIIRSSWRQIYRLIDSELCSLKKTVENFNKFVKSKKQIGWYIKNPWWSDWYYILL